MEQPNRPGMLMGLLEYLEESLEKLTSQKVDRTGDVKTRIQRVENILELRFKRKLNPPIDRVSPDAYDK